MWYPHHVHRVFATGCSLGKAGLEPVTMATESLSWVIIDTKTVVFLTIFRCSLGWMLGCAERRGPVESVSQSRSNDRCSASKSDCVAVVCRCIYAAPVAHPIMLCTICLFSPSCVLTFIFRTQPSGFRLQVALKRLLPDLLLDPWISSSHQNYSSESNRSL